VRFPVEKDRGELAGILSRPFWVLSDDREEGLFGVVHSGRQILPNPESISAADAIGGG
jgi:hypothetical protein